MSASDTTGSSSVSGYRASTTDVSGGTVSSWTACCTRDTRRTPFEPCARSLCAASGSNCSNRSSRTRDTLVYRIGSRCRSAGGTDAVDGSVDGTTPCSLESSPWRTIGASDSVRFSRTLFAVVAATFADCSATFDAWSTAARYSGSWASSGHLGRVAATLGWWRGGDGDGDAAGAETTDPDLSSCELRSGKFQTRRARSSWRTYPATNRNSSLNRLLQRAAIALEPPANVSPQPTSYDPLNTIQFFFLSSHSPSFSIFVRLYLIFFFFLFLLYFPFIYLYVYFFFLLYFCYTVFPPPIACCLFNSLNIYDRIVDCRLYLSKCFCRTLLISIV